MIEIILLVAAVSGIVALARGRGGIPWVWGVVSAVGYIATVFVVALILALLKSPEPIVASVAGWLWLGAVALFLRFGLGAQHAQSDSDWFCTNCKTYNKKSAVICEACRQTWESQQQSPTAANPEAGGNPS